MTESPSRGDALFVLAVALAATAVNVAKPVHMDDTAYLAIAEALRADPLHPFSALFDWSGSLEPLHRTNQPILIPALLAPVLAATGGSTVAAHGVIALFVLLGTAAFLSLARDLAPAAPRGLTAALILGPAVLPAQNLMFDLPMTALWLVTLRGLLAPVPTVGRDALAALAAALALLTKYSSLVLLPLFALGALLRRRPALLAWLAVPLAALAGWSLFNLTDYGGIHLLGRERLPLTAAGVAARTLDWIAALGAVSPAAFLAIPLARRDRGARVALVAGVAAAAASLALSFLRFRTPVGENLLRAGFLAAGAMLLVLAFDAARAPGEGPFGLDPRRLLLGATIVGTALFMVLFSPFLAVRHVLPALSAILLLAGARTLPAASRPARVVALAATLLLGTLLAVSDHRLAAAYRDAAPVVAGRAAGPGTTWFVGHWGWAWYAPRAGMRPHHANRPALAPGDRVVVPDNLDGRLPDAAPYRLVAIDEWTVPSSPLTVIRTQRRSGYYAGGHRHLSWTVTTAPLERFVIYRVE